MIFASTQPPQFPSHHRAVAAQKVLKLRRKRSQAFDRQLFGEPAWDILLSAYVASAQGRDADITMLARWADVPMTTALRCIENLERRGLITRREDPTDRRRWYVEATAQAIETLDEIFEEFSLPVD